MKGMEEKPSQDYEISKTPQSRKFQIKIDGRWYDRVIRRQKKKDKREENSSSPIKSLSKTIENL